jgi:hypothetical protein
MPDIFPHLSASHFFLFFTIILIFILSYYYAPPLIRQKTPSTCPTILWTYHRTASPTPRQALCLETWRNHHPASEWTINVLTPSTVRGFIHGLPDPVTEAPLLRDHDRWEEAIALHALYEHGGIWLDSHTYLRRSLSDFLPEHKEVAGFRYTAPPFCKATATVIDKRAIACQRRNPLIKQWLSEYMRLLGFSSTEEYLKSIYTETPLSTFTFPVDWVMAFALQHSLLQEPYPMESIHLYPVETGPLRHEQEARGDPKKAESIALHSDSQPIVFLGP